MTTSFHLAHEICDILLSPKPIYRMSLHWTPLHPKELLFLLLLHLFLFFLVAKTQDNYSVGSHGGHASRFSQLFLEFYLFIKSSNSCHIWISKPFNFLAPHILKKIVKFLFNLLSLWYKAKYYPFCRSHTRLWHYFMCKHSMYQSDSPPGPPPTRMKRKESKND